MCALDKTDRVSKRHLRITCQGRSVTLTERVSDRVPGPAREFMTRLRRVNLSRQRDGERAPCIHVGTEDDSKSVKFPERRLEA